jgi:hypothetical protein
VTPRVISRFRTVLIQVQNLSFELYYERTIGRQALAITLTESPLHLQVEGPNPLTDGVHGLAVPGRLPDVLSEDGAAIIFKSAE